MTAVTPTNYKMRWTPAEDDYLALHYASTPLESMSHRLGRGVRVIQKRANRLGLIRRPGAQRKLDGASMAWMRKALKIRHRVSLAAIAQRTGLSISSVQRYAEMVAREMEERVTQ